MSPLRKWFTEHGHPGWYSWMVVVGTSVTSAVLAILLSIHSSQRAVEAEREARLAAVDAERESRLASERALCDVVSVFLDTNREARPDSKRSAIIAKKMGDLRDTIDCPPEGK